LERTRWRLGRLPSVMMRSLIDGSKLIVRLISRVEFGEVISQKFWDWVSAWREVVYTVVSTSKLYKVGG
jgi:hypothetical protein